ncbi:antibiotic biosynthesis monooxygenase [bacterium]|nr:antibiotic biosynthesis monooxygenase [bacterium]
MISASASTAQPIRTPEGNMPMVHWAVIESAPGSMQEMAEIAAQTVGAQTAKEAGTYALYSGVEEDNPDVMRLLEIYESFEAYRIHCSSEAFQEYRARRLPLLKNLEIIEADAVVFEQKAEGEGSAVYMYRYEVRPERLAEYQKAVKEEAVRAVRDDEGVLGIFVTADHRAPNIIYTMEIFRDEAAYQRYVESKAYAEYLPKLSSIFLNAEGIKNKPARVVLSAKGLQKPEYRP